MRHSVAATKDDLSNRKPRPLIRDWTILLSERYFNVARCWFLNFVSTKFAESSNKGILPHPEHRETKHPNNPTKQRHTNPPQPQKGAKGKMARKEKEKLKKQRLDEVHCSTFHISAQYW